MTAFLKFSLCFFVGAFLPCFFREVHSLQHIHLLLFALEALILFQFLLYKSKSISLAYRCRGVSGIGILLLFVFLGLLFSMLIVTDTASVAANCAQEQPSSLSLQLIVVAFTFIAARPSVVKVILSPPFFRSLTAIYWLLLLVWPWQAISVFAVTLVLYFAGTAAVHLWLVKNKIHANLLSPYGVNMVLQYYTTIVFNLPILVFVHFGLGKLAGVILSAILIAFSKLILTIKPNRIQL